MSEDGLNPEMLLKEIKNQEEQKLRGKLKIFFGYSAGVGKTYAMLESAHLLLKAGIDVVIGYVEPHQRPATLALFEGLPQIAPLQIKYKDINLYELDIDSALKRHPTVILVDELANTNASGCRHTKRYQDVEELLKAGIDVYTTVNVQHIEGVQDVVEAITGVAVRERVPDHVFNSADKVELVDIDPEDLIIRLEEGKIYEEIQAKRALSSFFTKENLVALREIALRRTADRVNISVEKNKAVSLHTDYVTGEHILMCLSSSPSNAKVVRTAVKMAEAFHGTLTALFVETDDFSKMNEENLNRLRENLHLAEQLGAKIATVYGEDVPYQVAEYAKTSSVSKIVLGRPVSKAILGFMPQNFVDKLNIYAPNFEIFVIPNTLSSPLKNSDKSKARPQAITISDTLKTLACLAAATIIGFWFDSLGFSEANIVTTYVLASLFTAVITEGKAYSIISSLLSVMMFNFFFTDPRYSLQVYNLGYPVTFIITFLSALITSTFTKRVKTQARRSALKAHRTEVLLETSQKISMASNRNEIFTECITQIKKLLDKEVVLYPVNISVAIPKVIKRSGGKKIIIDKPNKSIFVPMDAGLIIQVLINLLDNALKHTKEDAVVKISYENVGAQFSISVIDNGGGIPPERIDKIFEPFYTSSKVNSDNQRGMGLGLSICKSIIEAHGGLISCENNSENGATFKILLPMEV